MWNDRIKLIREGANELGVDVARNRFCHYTSLSVLFSILENDECWITNARFSNDLSEELLLGDKRCIRDDYIMCFCDNGDQLSQWRGYCHNGGASIRFYLHEPMNFSILWANHDAPTCFELYENRPLPVIYFPCNPSYADINEFKNVVERFEKVRLEDIWPYIKNNAFNEERELRMVFPNIEGCLDKCVRFRTLDNGVKVPYMVIKCGDIGKMYGKCQTNINEITDEYLDKLYKGNKPLWIGEGSNQREIYEKVREKVDQFLVGKDRKIRIFCRGHFPIMQIRVAPSYDQNRIVEQIKRFCRGKYWLQDVEVLASEIPFVQSLT